MTNQIDTTVANVLDAADQDEALAMLGGAFQDLTDQELEARISKESSSSSGGCYC